MTLHVALPDLDATARLARSLAPCLHAGDVVELRGAVGAGKTTFVQQLALALDCLDVVRSPTYTVAHEYLLGDGRRLAHLDLYRAGSSLDESAWGDLLPALDGAISCVEWPDAVTPWLGRRPTWHLDIDVVGPKMRVARLRVPEADAATQRSLLDAVLAGPA